MSDEDDQLLATVASGGILVFSSKIVGLGLGFLTQLVMARLLTGDQYGSVVLTLAIINIAALAAKLGMDDGTMRQFPAFEDSPAEAKGVIRASIVIGTSAGLVAAIGVFGLAPYISHQVFNNQSLVKLLRIGAISIPFIVISSIAISLVRGARDARPHAFVDQIFRPGMRFVLITILIFTGYETVGAITGQVTAVILATILAVYLAKRSLPSFEVSPARMYRSVLEFSTPLIAVQGMGFLSSNLDIYMVGYFLTPSSVSVYNVSLQLANILTAITLTLGFLLPPALTRLQKQEKKNEMNNFYQILTKWITLIAIPIFTVLFFAPELVIGVLFGETYVSGVPVLRILLIGLLFTTTMGLINRALIGLGRNRAVAHITFGKFVTNFILNIFLIPWFGIIGAAGAMTVSIFIENIIGVRILKREYGVHPFSYKTFIPIIILSIVAIGSYGIINYFSLSTSLVIVFVAAAYPFILKSALGPKDKKLLQQFERNLPQDLNRVQWFIDKINYVFRI